MITFENASALLGIPLVIFATLFSCFCFFRVQKKLQTIKTTQKNGTIASFKKRFMARTIFWTISALCLLIAYAEPYMGTRLQATPLSGNALSFVFDISYSMTARDMPSIDENKITSSRLEYMVAYASQLLEKFSNTPVSVVLAKGSGVLAIPSTDNYTPIYSLLKALSPQMLSSIGTDLGSGIEKAAQSFPAQMANKSVIVVFTDGDETKQTLQSAINNLEKYGIEVVIIGIGSTVETAIFAGDGITTVQTALRQSYLQDIANTSNFATYVNALDVGAVLRNLKIDKKSISLQEKNLTYRQEPYPRFMFFLILSICTFFLGLIIMEIHLPNKKIINFMLLSFFVFVVTACSDNSKVALNLLIGNFAWRQQNYSDATVAFLQAKTLAQAYDDAPAEAYAEFALASTYLAQNETQAALERIKNIPQDISPELSFGTWYNSGIIAHQQGDYQLASEYFKKALQSNPQSLEAKINLELSKEEIFSTPPQEGLQEMIPVNEADSEDSAEQMIFSIIREKEKNQWKAQESENLAGGGLDY